MDAKLDRIDELMQKLGLSYDDDEEEEEDEKQEDMMRLLRGTNGLPPWAFRSADNPSGYMLSGVVIR